MMHSLQETASAALPVPSTEMAATARLPTEILLKIIRMTLTSALLSSTLVVHGQFAQLPTTCSGCVYRRLACVSRTWRELARTVLTREVVLAAGCGSAERDEQVLNRLEASPVCALGVRTIDASLRGVHGAGWIPVPALPRGEEGDGPSGHETGIAGISTGQARWERWHEQCMARERHRLNRILSLCTELTTLDVDVGFFHDVVSSSTTTTQVLPKSIRRLTMRNAGAVETFAILQALPRLEDFTLRLALDWRLPPLHGLDFGSMPRLRRFELSTTAFGKPCLHSIRAMLGNSQQSLAALAFRNKGAFPEALQAFRLVATEIMQQTSSQVEELTIQDISRHRSTLVDPSTSEATWFPARAQRLPRLRRLHLTGLSIPVGFFTRTIAVPDNQLERLTIEDFGSTSLAPLIDALQNAPAVQSLQELAIAVSWDREDTRTNAGAQQTEQRRIEDWCSRPKGPSRIQTRLLASWKMDKVEGSAQV
ncbi:hypothetical protein JCM3774_001177 [Rhodotorula dairenensis]